MVTVTAFDWGRPEKEQIQIGTLTYGVGIDDSYHVGYDAALLGQWLPEFERMLAITYPAMHCHTPEDRNLKMHHCENLKHTWSSNVTNPHTAVRCSHSAITFSGTPLLLTRNCRIIWVSSSELMFWLSRRSTISRLVLKWSISIAALPPVLLTPQFCRSNATNNHIPTITITNKAYCQVWGPLGMTPCSHWCVYWSRCSPTRPQSELSVLHMFVLLNDTVKCQDVLCQWQINEQVWRTGGKIQSYVAWKRGYSLRNASLDDFIIVWTSQCVLTQT